ADARGVAAEPTQARRLPSLALDEGGRGYRQHHHEPIPRRNASTVAFASRGTRFDAYDENASRRSSALIAAGALLSFPCVPELLTLARIVRPVTRSCTNASVMPLASPRTRFVASDVNATRRPSG